MSASESAPESAVKFSDLGLNEQLLKSLAKIGYETPSPIQAATIPHLLAGKDVLGMAQTGTGKTAAFSLPLLANVDLRNNRTQIMVLAPTRELAIQVSDAFEKYGQEMPGLRVTSICGGQPYPPQILALKRGAHVVVGTPGRVMDHIRKGTLDLGKITALVLDEADEMLKMGFIDDIKWVLEHTPKDCQMALFSATMPKEIRRIADSYLTNPEQVTIASKTATVSTITQKYIIVKGYRKLEAMTRIFESENFDGVIVFVRTKSATLELSELLTSKGYSCAPLNGDIQQSHRERTIKHLKSGKIDIVVATDVAARGIDVERVSHVINFDAPHDPESYIHRIGRTGRAGRSGTAILFVAPRERGALRSIERVTKQPITCAEVPSSKEIEKKRLENFYAKVTANMAGEDTEVFKKMIQDYQLENPVDDLTMAIALVKMIDQLTPLRLKEERFDQFERKASFEDGGDRRDRGDRGARKFGARDDSSRRRSSDRSDRRDSSERAPRRVSRTPDADKTRFRIEVGHSHGARPGNIVGAIANEINLRSENIGQISIQDDHSTVDLPSNLSAEKLSILRKVRVAGQQLSISHLGGFQSPSKDVGKKKKYGTSNKRKKVERVETSTAPA